jgi:hypothetical protein
MSREHVIPRSTFADCAKDSIRNKLLAPAPLIALLDRLKVEHKTVADRAPNSDLVSMLASFRADLSEAIDSARNLDQWISVEELHQITGRPASTITALCRKHKQVIGATKMGGSWMIDLSTFSHYFNDTSLTSQETAP